MLKLKGNYIIFCFFCLLILCFSCKAKRGLNSDSQNSSKIANFNYAFYEAIYQKSLGNYDKALEMYSAALHVDSTNSCVYYEIANILNNANDPNAVVYAKKAVDFDKTNNPYYKLLLSFIYKIQAQPEKSAEVLKSLIKTQKNKISYYFELSLMYQSAKKYKEALKIIEDAEKQFGTNETILIEKEKIYRQSGDEKKSIEQILKLIDFAPQNLQYKVMLAEAYVISGDKDKATKIYSEIENTVITDYVVYLSLADYYIVNNQYEKLFSILEKFYRDAEAPVDLKVETAYKMLQAMGSDKFFVEQIGKLIAIMADIYNNNVTVRSLHADYLFFMKDYKAAAKEYDFIIQNVKDKFELWKNILYIDYLNNDIDNLYKHSKEAVSLYPNVLEFYKYYIPSLYTKEKYKELTEVVEEASVLAITDQVVLIEFLSMQGDAYHKLNEHHKSDSIYELILFKDSENTSILNNYSYFLAERSEKLDKALEMSTKLMQLNNKESYYLDTHAWVLYKNQKFQEALEYIDKALLITPDNFTYLEHKGDILYKLGKIDEALNLWKRAKETGGISDELNKKIETKKMIDKK